MKLKAPDAVAARARSPINWFLGICLAAFLTTLSASAAVPPPSAEELNAAEKWVVERVTAGKEADLSKQFPEEKDRQLSAHFLEDLLTGARPDVTLHRHGVQINWASIDEPIDLSNARIPCEVQLDHCIFKGQVDLGGADIARNFSVQGAKFQKGAVFWRMKAGGDAFFSGTVFEGPVDFAGTDIAGDFNAGRKFQKGASSLKMKVGGGASFNHAVFEGPVDLRYADFGVLDMSGASWPKDPAQFQMQGVSYKTILAEEPNSHEKLLDVAKQAAYSTDVYSRLEEFFLRQGYRAEADEAFIKGKQRERKENLHGLSWFGSWLLDWLVGYGRHPWQAGIPCAVLIALGCVLFSPKKMEPQNPEDTPRVYNRFWYSLGLFLPFVDLQSNKVWKPKADQTFLRNYMRAHILLGWILVPLVLAAVTGLIK